MSSSRHSDEDIHPIRAKRERRKDARPGELLEAALELFVEKGFAATRVEEVAARAGVSKGTLFLYFPSKEELFKAVVRENISGRIAEWHREYDGFEGDSAQMLRQTLHTWWERVGNTHVSGITKLMVSEGSNFPDLAQFYQREVVQPGLALLRRILQRGIDRGEFAPIDVNHAVYTLAAPMTSIMLWRHSAAVCTDHTAPFDPEKCIAAQLDLLLNGLLRAGPRRP